MRGKIGGHMMYNKSHHLDLNQRVKDYMVSILLEDPEGTFCDN